MDPGFVERHWSALPNLAAIRDRGGFSRLRTTTPPQSPVAWSTFITGLAPAAHGIFDFVQRDPATMQPYSSESRNEDPRFELSLGPYLLPLAGSRVILLRKGAAFWQLLADRGIPVTIMRIPANYPPIAAGEALAGMGTPDLEGTLGTFSFFTSDPTELERAVPGGHIFKTRFSGGRAVLRVPGPANPLRKDHAAAYATLTVDVDPEQPIARLSIGGNETILRQGEWSDWIAADFPLLPHIISAHGMFRAFAKQLHPGFELYVSAVNIDPLAPSLPISAPASFSRRVVLDTGQRYYTLGTPEDTAALRQGVFDLPQFLSQTHLVLDDERKLLSYSLDRFHDGLLFYYFSVVDQNSHMLWGKHDAELLDFYRAVDASIGEAARREPAADLIIMSDHGFTAFDRAVNLNTWLYERGFLALNGAPGDDAQLGNIDWANTEAYALGLNGLYLNRSGRERHGVVPSGERSRALIATIREQLLAFRDPDNGRQVVETAYETNPRRDNARIAPDLIVGYAPGYRASWQTGLGDTPAAVVRDNDDAWIGDHCINAADVPGVLFTNGKQRALNPGLEDVTVTILRLFGVSPAPGMRGRSIY